MMFAGQNRKRWIIAGGAGCLGVVCLCLASVWFLLGGGNEIFSRVARPPAPAPQPKVAVSSQNIGQIEELYRLQMVGPVHSLAWSLDGKLLAVSAEQPGIGGTATESFELWDITRGRALLSIRRGGFIGSSISFALSPDGQTLAYLDNNTVKLWDIVTERELRTLVNNSGEHLGYLAFLPDGKTIASINPNDRAVITWDVETGRELSARNGSSVPPSQPDDYLIYSPDFAPFMEDRHSYNGRVIEHSNILVDTAKSGRTTLITIVLSDSASGQTLRTLEANVNYSGNLADVFSPDDSLLASAGYVWDVQTGKRYGLNVGANLAAFSPDGKFLAIGGQDGRVQLWGIRP